jgi:Shikimate 5-dehydrogenase
MEKRISGTTGLFTLLGSPVGHSGSPAMYNFSFKSKVWIMPISLLT